MLSVIKALDIDVTERAILEEEEDIALMAAMEEGLKSGIATEQEKNDFESFLSAKQAMKYEYTSAFIKDVKKNFS